MNLNATYGLAEDRLRFTAGIAKKFNSKNNLRITLSGGTKLTQFNDSEPISPLINSISTLFFESNYLKGYNLDFAQIKYRQELFNGLEVFAKIGYEKNNVELVLQDINLMKQDLSKKEFIKLSKQLKKTTVFITHDLDEAVKVGHRIAIMRDGMVIQIGTPEEIVMNPEDNYVADFVKGISRLEVVKAKSIMKPVDAFKKEYGAVPKGALKMNENDDLSSLIETSVSSNMPIIINNSNNEEIGIVSQKDLLVAIVEGQDE